METFIGLSLLSAVGIGRLYIGMLASELVAKLPDEERVRVERWL